MEGTVGQIHIQGSYIHVYNYHGLLGTTCISINASLVSLSMGFWVSRSIVHVTLKNWEWAQGWGQLLFVYQSILTHMCIYYRYFLYMYVIQLMDKWDLNTLQQASIEKKPWKSSSSQSSGEADSQLLVSLFFLSPFIFFPLLYLPYFVTTTLFSLELFCSTTFTYRWSW